MDHSAIKKLTWKYFLKDKWKEISDFFSEYYSIFAVSMIILGVCFQVGWMTSEVTELPYSPLVGIIGLYLIGFWVLIGLIVLIKIICEWINSNWEKAKQKARGELR